MQGGAKTFFKCYNLTMKKHERQNIIFRLLSAFFLLIVIGMVVFSSINMFTVMPQGIVLDCVAIYSLSAFCLFQIVLILVGWKKDSNLGKIAFEEGERINVFPVVMVSIGAVFGLAITVMTSVIYCLKDSPEDKINVLVILCIGLYLLMNTCIYYLYLIMFRKRAFKLEDLLK